MRKDSLFIDLLERMHLVEEPWKDILKYWVLNRVYYYGDHNRINPEGKMKPSMFNVKKAVIDYYVILRANTFKRIHAPLVQNNAYFGLNIYLNSLGYNTTAVPWNLRFSDSYTGDIRMFSRCKNILRVEEMNFNDAISAAFIEELEIFIDRMKSYIVKYNIKATFHSNDMHILDNITLRIFDELSKPSFIFLHGIPTRYNDLDDNRSKYLLVWGDKLKQNYIKGGVDANKIIITGHPYYSNLPFPKEIKFDVSNILVLTMDIPAIPHSSYYFNPGDRSGCLYYVYSVQHVLQRLGIRHARLRCHPGENIAWYLKYIDTSFYSIDNENLKTSLQKSTLVIGPSSTVAFESLFHGVNYVVYEPRDFNEKCLTGLSPVSPFDSSEPKMNTCHDEEGLKYILEHKYCVDLSILREYIQDHFDISQIKQIVG